MRLALLGLLLVTTLAYSRLWRAEFVYEDANAVSQNPAVVGTAPIAVDRARWISALSHRLVYVVSTKPRLHHAVNLGLHLGNGLLVYAIAGAFVTSPAAWLAAAIFLLHPLQSEAVAYVASRSELLATAFALFAFWRSLTADRWYRHLVVWGAVALAVCAKESAAAIVPLIAIADVFRGRSISRWWYAALLAPVLAMAYSVFQFDYLSRADLNQFDYAATQAYAVWRYLGIVLVPIGQSVDHDFDLVAWGWRYFALLGMWALALIPLVGAITAFNGDTRQLGRLWDDSDRYRVAAFGVTWLLITLGPRFVMRIPEVLNEHQLYGAMFGISLTLAVVVSPLLTKGPICARA